jgi:hypothetical protein
MAGSVDHGDEPMGTINVLTRRTISLAQWS